MADSAWLRHVDMDQFIAAVEVRRRPELRGRPVVVGGNGDPTRARMVVATASYEAREFGVHSGMPLRAAARRCPDAVFLPSDPDAYLAASAEVMAVLRSFPVLVEAWGLDEAFVGGDIADPQALAADLKAAVHARTGLSCAIGIGRNKHQAKIAAKFGKPGGVYTLTDETWMAHMGDRPVEALWGVGTKTTRKLNELGVHTVAALAATEPEALLPRFHINVARWLPALARGAGDATVVTEPRVAKSRGRETTFARDLTGRDQIEEQVSALARALGEEVLGAGRRVARVAVKIRSASFFDETHIHTLRGGPTGELSVIENAALALLDQFALDRPVRLIGVRAELAPDDQDRGTPNA
jgi:DNA polymerase IV